MSFGGQFRPEDVREITGWYSPEGDATVYVRMGIASAPDDRQGYNSLVFQCDPASRVGGNQPAAALLGLAGFRTLLAALGQVADQLERDRMGHAQVPWPPQQAEGGGGS